MAGGESSSTTVTLSCCRVCTKGKACGDSCINVSAPSSKRVRSRGRGTSCPAAPVTALPYAEPERIGERLRAWTDRTRAIGRAFASRTVNRTSVRGAGTRALACACAPVARAGGSGGSAARPSLTTGVPAAKVPTARVPTARIPATGVPTARVPATGIPTARVPATGIPTARVPATGIPTARVPATGSATATARPAAR
jgi:hypothetical protein